MLEAALEAVRDGWAVFPLYGVTAAPGCEDMTPGADGWRGVCDCGEVYCRDAGKHPRVSGGVKAATRDERVVREWWAKWPEANIAGACGRVSDRLVIDLDLGHETDGEWNFERWAAGAGIDVPETRRVRTGSGGVHLVFGWADGIRNAVNWLDGVDIRSEGGYVVLPPSAHVSGGRYATEREMAPAPLGQMLEGALRFARGRGPKGRRGPGEGGPAPVYDYRVACSSGPPKGARDHFFNARAFELRMSDVPWDQAIVTLRQSWDACDQPQGDEYPWETVVGKAERVWAEVEPEPLPDWDPLAAVRREAALDPDWVDEERATDLGNARKLVRYFGQWLRYTPSHGWVIWDNRCWAPDIHERIIGAAVETTKRMQVDAKKVDDLALRDDLVKWSVSSQNRTRLEAMIRVARADGRVACAMDGTFNGPRTWDLLNVPNGCIDLRTGELRGHRMEDMMTHISPVEYVPGAHHDSWVKFLNDVTGGDVDLQAYLQRAAGYSLTGWTTEEVFFIVYGPKASGKSTFVDALSTVLGTLAIGMQPDVLAHTKYGTPANELAELYGRRLASASEWPKGVRMNADLLKQMTGGDKVVGRHLYKDRFEFVPTHKWWITTNNSPPINDEAIWRRVRRVPFPRTVPEGERDARIKGSVKDPGSGLAQAVLAWCVEGAVEWRRRGDLAGAGGRGLGTCAVVEADTAEYEESQDRWGHFVDEELVLDPTGVVTSKELYERYKTWCADNGEYLMTMTAFGIKLMEWGILEKMTGKRPVAWRGCSLRERSIYGLPTYN